MQTNLPGAAHEIEFWKGFVKSDRFINGWLPDNIKTPDLVQEVADFFLAQPDAEVLDCGSGVVSILRGTVPNEKLKMCDVLAYEYEKIFDYKAHGIIPPFPSACEELIFDGMFDIVHISNALDHCQQPDKAFWAMYRAVKPGGFLVVQGFTNEGTFEKWQGMHNWDLDIENNLLTLADKTRLCTVLASKPYTAKKITLETGKEWFIFIQQKPSA